MAIDHWLTTIPPLAVYLAVAGVVGIESLGVPLPGEVVLVSAALLSSRPEVPVSPVWVALAALVGAAVGDSIGYAVGRRYGIALLERAGRRFPKHFGPARLGLAERAFARWGVLTVVVGRFIAILRILAGPLAGALRMPYARFVPANVLGGLLWTAGTTTAIYTLGVVADTWLKRFSYAGLAAAVVVGATAGWMVKRRVAGLLEASASAGGECVRLRSGYPAGSDRRQEVDVAATPFPDFDHATVDTVRHRIRSLERDDVQGLLDHEHAHAARMPVIEVLRTRIAELDAGATPSGGDQTEARGGETSHGSPVSPDGAAQPGPPDRHGLREVTWGG